MTNPKIDIYDIKIDENNSQSEESSSSEEQTEEIQEMFDYEKASKSFKGPVKSTTPQNSCQAKNETDKSLLKINTKDLKVNNQMNQSANQFYTKSLLQSQQSKQRGIYIQTEERDVEGRQEQEED